MYLDGNVFPYVSKSVHDLVLSPRGCSKIWKTNMNPATGLNPQLALYSRRISNGHNLVK
jgi:hypothetical protein